MNLTITLTDTNNRTTQRTETRRWLLNLISSYLAHGRTIEIRTGGGTIHASASARTRNTKYRGTKEA